MATSATVGTLNFGFKLDTSGFSSGLKKAEKQLNAFADKAASLAKPAAAIGAGLAVAAGGFLAFEKAQVDAIKNSADAAEAAGISADAYMQLNAVFGDLAGGSEAFGAGIGKLNVLMGEAAQGSVTAQQKLAQFGILSTDTTEQALAKVANKIQAAGSSGEKAALAVDVLGKSGKDLVPILNAGAEGLAKMRAEAVASGQALSQGDIAVAIGLWGQFDAIGDRFEGALQKLAVAAAPIASLMLDIGESLIKGLSDAIPMIMDFIIEISPYFTNFRENLLLGFIKLGETLVNVLIAPFRIVAGAIAVVLDGIAVGISETIRVAAEAAAKALDAIGADDKAASMRKMGESMSGGILDATAGLHKAAESLVNGAGVSFGDDIKKQIDLDNQQAKADLEKLFGDRRKELEKAGTKDKAAVKPASPFDFGKLGQAAFGTLKGAFGTAAGLAAAVKPPPAAEPVKAPEPRFAALALRGSQEAFSAIQGSKQDKQVTLLGSIDKTLKAIAKPNTNSPQIVGL